jgi:hypothetical protein
MSPAVRSICCIVVAGSLLLLQACAPSVVRQQTAALQPAQSPIRVTLVDEIEAHIGTGYPARLKLGTTWQLVGSIPEGDVYKPLDQILTLEGADVHEAYIVISDSLLAGFYLPVEKSFSPVSRRMPLNLR